MSLIRLLLGAVVGGIAGAALGIAITVAYVAAQPPDNPRNPGAKAVSPMFGIVAVPVCALAGISTGIKFARKVDHHDND